MRSLFATTAIAALVVGGELVFGAPASATTLKAVFTGTFDYIGDSGQEGDQDIPFIATVFYDPSLGSDIETTPYYEKLSGGTGSGYVSPFLSVTFTAPGAVPGLNLVFPGDQNGAITVGYYNTGPYIELRSSYYGDTGGGYDALHGFDLDFNSPNLTMDPSQLFVSSPGEYGAGDLESEFYYSDPSLHADSLTITAAAAVPEPATWSMFLIGLLGLSGTVGGLRRRKKGSRVMVAA